MNVTDVRSIVEQVVAECRRHPDLTATDALVAMARAHGQDPTECAYVSYEFDFYRGGTHVASEIMSRKTWTVFKRKHLIRHEPIYFGEIDGKHSDVTCTWDEVDKTLVRRGWRVDEAADVAIAMLASPDEVDTGELANETIDSDDEDDASNKRAECEDAEVPAAKRVAPADS